VLKLFTMGPIPRPFGAFFWANTLRFLPRGSLLNNNETEFSVKERSAELSVSWKCLLELYIYTTVKRATANFRVSENYYTGKIAATAKRTVPNVRNALRYCYAG